MFLYLVSFIALQTRLIHIMALRYYVSSIVTNIWFMINILRNIKTTKYIIDYWFALNTNIWYVLRRWSKNNKTYHHISLHLKMDTIFIVIQSIQLVHLFDFLHLPWIWFGHWKTHIYCSGETLHFLLFVWNLQCPWFDKSCSRQIEL